MKHETSEAAIHGSDGLDTLANLAILGESESISGSSVAGADLPTTTRHPRHRPGCSCIVCIQPPSGKGPKHKQSCTCNVCNTVRRRFRTLMMRRGGKGQSESSSDPPTCPTSPTPPMSPQPSAGGAYVGDVGSKGQSGIAVDVGPSPSPIGSAVAGMILFWCVAFFYYFTFFFPPSYTQTCCIANMTDHLLPHSYVMILYYLD